MIVDERLVDAAVRLLNRRWPAAGWAVTSAMYLDDGQVITSVGLDNLNAGAVLCAEVGALCQAYTLNRQVAASVCVCRDGDRGSIVVLAPCGICQERLALWGPDVQVAVPTDGQPGGWMSLRLADLHPYYWGSHFATDGGWPSSDRHRS
ncbi:cytidine deaminase [Amycolatopsis arida]|uniref:cytidine deaminase n=1 Tax=Amycolatopsis arida TaxID=587909 RepID=UPI000B84D4E0|nr:cytidine deaminase [Amycolatopsis arida]